MGNFLHKNKLIRKYLSDYVIRIIKEENDTTTDIDGSTAIGIILPDTGENNEVVQHKIYIEFAKKNIISSLIRLEPQDYYKLDQYTKTYIAEFKKINKIELAPQFDSIIKEHTNNIRIDINSFYLPAWEEAIEDIRKGEINDIKELEDSIDDIINIVREKVDKYKSEIEKKEQEFSKSNTILEQHTNSLSLNSDHTSDNDLQKYFGWFYGAWVLVVFFLFPEAYDTVNSPYRSAFTWWFILKPLLWILGFVPGISIYEWLREKYITYKQFLERKAKGKQAKLTGENRIISQALNKLKQGINTYPSNIANQEIESIRRSRQSAISSKLQQFINLVTEKIIQKYFVDINDNKNAKMDNVSFDDFMKRSIISDMVEKAKSGQSLKLSDSYNNKINEFIKRVENAVK